MGHRSAVLTPTRTLLYQGGGKPFEGNADDMPTPVSHEGEGMP
jgi:hypothetical protein